MSPLLLPSLLLQGTSTGATRAARRSEGNETRAWETGAEQRETEGGSPNVPPECRPRLCPGTVGDTNIWLHTHRPPNYTCEYTVHTPPNTPLSTQYLYRENELLRQELKRWRRSADPDFISELQLYTTPCVMYMCTSNPLTVNDSPGLSLVVA